MSSVNMIIFPKDEKSKTQLLSLGDTMISTGTINQSILQNLYVDTVRIKAR